MIKAHALQCRHASLHADDDDDDGDAEDVRETTRYADEEFSVFARSRREMRGTRG